MTDTYVGSAQRFGCEIEVTIPVHKYSELCSCVFCWNFVDMRECTMCGKLFCKGHETNHICFREKSNTISPILVAVDADARAVEIP